MRFNKVDNFYTEGQSFHLTPDQTTKIHCNVENYGIYEEEETLSFITFITICTIEPRINSNT